MGNCLSAEVFASEDASSGDRLTYEGKEKSGTKHDLKRNKDTFSRGQSVLSPTRRRGTKVAPGSHNQDLSKSQPPARQIASYADAATKQDLPQGHGESMASPCTASCLLPSYSSSSTCSHSLLVEGALAEDFSLGQTLGSGRYGTVVACTRKCDGQKLACKLISHARGAQDASREMEVLSLVRGHPAVIRVEAVYMQRNTPAPRGMKSWKRQPHRTYPGKGLGRGELATEVPEVEAEVKQVQIVMERCYGGTLAERLKEKGCFSELESLRILRSILGTVELLHSNGFIHRDLKDTNFLFRTKDPGSPVVAIDFGLAATFMPGEVLNEVAGSPLYIAPEVVRREYGPQCDVWSAGVLLHQMLSGQHPFQRDTVTAVLRAVTTDGILDLESDPWVNVSLSTKNLLRAMLTRDPAVRPTPSQLLDLLGRDAGVPFATVPPEIRTSALEVQDDEE